MTTAFESHDREFRSPENVCYCCGAPKREVELVRLSCHNEVAICFDCLSWLNRQRGRKRRHLMRLALPTWLPSINRRKGS